MALGVFVLLGVRHPPCQGVPMPITYRPDGLASLPPARFTVLVDRQQHALDTFLRHLVGDAEEAADLLQDTFAEAWRATQQGRKPFVATSDEDQMRRWLFQVAYHKGIDVLRRRRLLRWQSLDWLMRWVGEPDNARPAFEEQVIEGEALRAALTKLSPQERSCFLLCEAHDLSAAEVGQIVGASPTVVRKRLSRAKQRLRALYQAHHLAVLEPLP